MKKATAIKPIWSRNIVARQKALGIQSIEKLAELAELPYPTVRDIVNGISEGGFEKRSKISKALNCSLSDLYSEPLDKIKGADIAFGGEILSKFSTLSPERKSLVLMFLFDDPAYLADDPALARAASGLLIKPKPRK